jgi:hypothetical protein
MEFFEANKLFIERPRKTLLCKAVELEQEIRFYTEPFLANDNTHFFNKFIGWADDRLSNETSINNFKNSITYPLNSVSIIDGAYKDLAKIWDAQNPYFNISYKSKNNDYETISELADINWWKIKGWNIFKSKPNTILLINLPKEQLGKYPEPFIQAIPIENVIDIPDSDTIDHIMFMYDDNIVAVVDNMVYQLYSINKEKQELNSLIFETPNAYKKCPAFFLSKIKFNDSNNIVRSNAIANSLGKLKNFVFLSILKCVIDPHSFYQFIVKYGITDCSYTDGNIHCNNGFLETTIKDDENGTFVNRPVRNKSGQGVEKCPLCNKSIGIGGYINRPIPSDPADKDLSNVVEFVSPETESLKYSEEYLKRYEENIYADIIGNSQILNPKLNHNKDTIKNNIEGKQSVLMDLKKMFDNVITDITLAKGVIKYGDVISDIKINLGDNFLLLDIQDIYAEKENATKYGLDSILGFTDAIIETKYKNNPGLKKRAKLIAAFKPFEEPIEKVEASYIAKTISKKDYFKCKYLEQYVNYFEANIQNLVSLTNEKEFKQSLEIFTSEFDKFFDLKASEIETSNKMLADIIGVGGTTSLVEIVSSTVLSGEQKSLLIQTLFNLKKEEADALTIVKTVDLAADNNNNNLIL